MDGLVAVVEVETPLDLGEYGEADGGGPFSVAAADRLVGRLDEQPYADLDEDEEGAPAVPVAGNRRGHRSMTRVASSRPASPVPARLDRDRRDRRAGAPAPQHHLPRAVAQEPDPGQLPAGEFGGDGQLRRGGPAIGVAAESAAARTRSP